MTYLSSAHARPPRGRALDYNWSTCWKSTFMWSGLAEGPTGHATLRARARSGARASQAPGGREVQARVGRGLVRARPAFVDNAVEDDNRSAWRTGRRRSACWPAWMPTSRPAHRIHGVTGCSDGAGWHDIGLTGLVGAGPREGRAPARQEPDTAGTGLRPRLGRRRGLRRPVVPTASLAWRLRVWLIGRTSCRGPYCCHAGVRLVKR